MILPSNAIETRVDDSVGTIILDRPAQKNALTRAMIVELTQAFRDMHQEKRVRSVVITASGETFSEGRDLAELMPSDDVAADLARWGKEAEEMRDLLVEMLEFPKPIIAAINGPALAAGAGLPLAADYVIGCPKAEIGFPEPRYGIIAGVSAPLLAFRIGTGQATRLLVSAKTIDAHEAEQLGLYHEVVDFDLLWARAQSLGKEMAESAPEAIQLTKRLILETMGETLRTELSSGAIADATALTTEAARRGLEAKNEGKSPDWE